MNVTTFKNMRDYFDIENKSDLWDHHVGNVYLWPLIRKQTYYYILNLINDYSNFQASPNILNVLNPGFCSELIKTGAFFHSNKRNYDSFFITQARDRIFDSNQNSYNDNFHSPYFKFFSNPLVFENHEQLIFKKPRQEDETYIFPYILLSMKLKSYKNSFNHKPAEISKTTEKVVNLFHIEKKFKDFYNVLKKQFSEIPFFLKYTDNIASRMDGKMVFMNRPYRDRGEMIKRFREYGIKTIELQHGYVGYDTPSYNYPNSNSMSIIKEYLPDYYLTYGQYWNEQIQMPNNVISVGNPLLNCAVKNLQKQTILPKTILIISQSTVTSKMVEITKFLSTAFPNYTLFFKLHPYEIPLITRYEVLYSVPNVKIMKSENIHDLIASCEIIVGYYSTVLIEAVAFKDKRIFIIQNDIIPDNIGYKFSDNEDLRDAILDGDLGRSAVEPSFFWEPNWEANFSSFLKKISH